jgi:hypothetical protein
VRNRVARVIRLSFFLLLAACNGGSKDSCVVPGHSVISSGTPASSCDQGTCEPLPLSDAGDASILFCTIDCTDAGQPACAIPNTTCVSARSKGFNIDKAYCVYTCDTDDAGVSSPCPSPYFCYAEAGVCL